MACDSGLIRQACRPGPDAKALRPDELRIVGKEKTKYYQSNWQSLLVKFARFANPNIANANTLANLSLDNQNQPIYFHATFLKPGRSTYIIERSQ